VVVLISYLEIPYICKELCTEILAALRGELGLIRLLAAVLHQAQHELAPDLVELQVDARAPVGLQLV